MTTTQLTTALAAASAVVGTAVVLTARLKKQLDVSHVNGLLVAMRVEEWDARHAADMLFFAPAERENPALMTREECSRAFEALTVSQRMEMMRMLR